MPECQNCGSIVSKDYKRVFSVDGETVRCCPQCEDRVRRNGIVVDAKGNAMPRPDFRTTYDPQYERE